MSRITREPFLLSQKHVKICANEKCDAIIVATSTKTYIANKNYLYTNMTVRINIRRLLRSLVTSFIFPLTLAILIDMQIGWFPLVTIGAIVIFIPLSTVIVTRVALSEMDQLIQALAPLDLEPNERLAREAEVTD